MTTKNKMINFARAMGRLSGNLFIPSLLVCAFVFNNVWLGLIPPAIPILAVFIYIALHWSSWQDEVIKETLDNFGKE